MAREMMRTARVLPCLALMLAIAFFAAGFAAAAGEKNDGPGMLMKGCDMMTEGMKMIKNKDLAAAKKLVTDGTKLIEDGKQMMMKDEKLMMSSEQMGVASEMVSTGSKMMMHAIKMLEDKKTGAEAEAGALMTSAETMINDGKKMMTGTGGK